MNKQNIIWIVAALVAGYALAKLACKCNDTSG